MTTVKEFEAQKDNIIETIEIAESYMYDIEEGMTASDIGYEIGHVSVRLGRARREIKDLKIQRPTCATCATCEHFIQELDNAGSCQKLVANEIINFTDGIATLVFTDFGCNWHSDYDEVKDE